MRARRARTRDPNVSERNKLSATSGQRWLSDDLDSLYSLVAILVDALPLVVLQRGTSAGIVPHTLALPPIEIACRIGATLCPDAN